MDFVAWRILRVLGLPHTASMPIFRHLGFQPLAADLDALQICLIP